MKIDGNRKMNEWMNKWMNEWINEWINEWMNEWMNERMNELEKRSTVHYDHKNYVIFRLGVFSWERWDMNTKFVHVKIGIF